MAKLVLGIGNILLKDEGIGCHVARALESQLGEAIPNIRIMDVGTCLDVLQPVEHADKLIIVDAVKGGGAPGQIYHFHLEDIAPQSKPVISIHDVNLVDNLMWLQHLRFCQAGISEVVVIGVEPKEIDWGLELSPQLREKMPLIIEAVLAELNTSPQLSREGEE
ncbi:MAG: hydrogenase maturation protease [Dehalococcoidia bacterium]